MIKMLIFLRKYLSSNLIPAFALNSAVLIFLSACSVNDPVEEYFRSHGMEYPADVAGIALLSINYSGIERDELLEPGAREFVKDGIMFVKEYFKQQDAESLIPGIHAVIVSKPVLFRDKSGEVGLMVTVTGFGTGNAGSKIRIKTEWVGKNKRFWKAENFAYFNRNDFYRWQFGGWVY